MMVDQSGKNEPIRNRIGKIKSESVQTITPQFFKFFEDFDDLLEVDTSRVVFNDAVKTSSMSTHV